jgi:hypothetical protein
MWFESRLLFGTRSAQTLSACGLGCSMFGVRCFGCGFSALRRIADL